MTDAVNHPEHRLPAGARRAAAVGAPRHVQRGIHAFNEAKLCEAARAHLFRRVLRRDGRHADLRVALGGQLCVQNQLVHDALVGRVRAADRDRAGDVGGVPFVLRCGIEHHHVAGRQVAPVAHVVQLRAANATADDGSVRRPRTAKSHELVLQCGLQLVFLARLLQPHGSLVALGADLRRPSDQCQLGGRLLRAQLVHVRMRVAHLDLRMCGREASCPLLAARERVLRREVARREIGQRVHGLRRGGERVHHLFQRAGRARVHAQRAHHVQRVGPLAVVELLARARRSDEQRRRRLAASHHHHERRIRLGVVRQVPEVHELEERSEVGDRRRRAEGHHHAVTKLSCEGITTGVVLLLRNLGRCVARRGKCPQREAGQGGGDTASRGEKTGWHHVWAGGKWPWKRAARRATAKGRPLRARLAVADPCVGGEDARVNIHLSR